MRDVTGFFKMKKELEEKVEELKKQREAILNLAEDLKEKNEELLKMQEILINQEKLASIGELAAGIAHELNNPLTTILTMIDLLLLEENLTEEEKNSLKSIKEEALRMRGIIQDLLTFARKKGESKHDVKLNEIINKAEVLLKTRLKHEGVDVIKELSEIPVIIGNDDRLIQVFINLFNNSIDAMDKVEKRIFIKTEFDKEKRKVRVIFEDNGCGMDDETRKRIFDPFFTTKKSGTGLGLSIVYGIIKDHSGNIFVESKVGEGTRFIIEFSVRKKNEEGFNC